MTHQPSNAVLPEITESTDLVVEPLSATIGAAVSGIDLASPPTAGHRDALVSALHEHGLLLFRGQPIDDASHKRLAATFGPLHSFPNSVGWEDPQVLVLDSTTTDAKRDGTAAWHTDASFETEPPSASVLRDVMVPSLGGDTIWASMYAAYDALSPAVQTFLGGLAAEHDNSVYLGHAMTSGELISAVHPVVVEDPVTGRPALYVNSQYTKRIVGLSPSESTHILRFLFDHVTAPEFSVRLAWEPGTIVVWEERVTQHCAVPGHTGRRILKRVTVAGDRPSGVGDAVSVPC